MSTKVVVIGGTGLIGSRVVRVLRAHGRPGRGLIERGPADVSDEGDLQFWPAGVCSDWIETIAAALDTGVDTMTREGLAEALKGASVAVDVSNSPSWEDDAVMNFFERSTRNLLAYEAAAGVGHHVALSVVGTERLLESGYFRAKLTQERLIQSSSIPYSIVRATQFFEFIKSIADFAAEGDTVRLPPVLIQPMAAEDVATAVAKVAVGKPLNGTIEVAGPETFRLDHLVRELLAARNDPRKVIFGPASALLRDQHKGDHAHPRPRCAPWRDPLRRLAQPIHGTSSKDGPAGGASISDAATRRQAKPPPLKRAVRPFG